MRLDAEIEEVGRLVTEALPTDEYAAVWRRWWSAWWDGTNRTKENAASAARRMAAAEEFYRNEFEHEMMEAAWSVSWAARMLASQEEEGAREFLARARGCLCRASGPSQEALKPGREDALEDRILQAAGRLRFVYPSGEVGVDSRAWAEVARLRHQGLSWVLEWVRAGHATPPPWLRVGEGQTL